MFKYGFELFSPSWKAKVLTSTVLYYCLEQKLLFLSFLACHFDIQNHYIWELQKTSIKLTYYFWSLGYIYLDSVGRLWHSQLTLWKRELVERSLGFLITNCKKKVHLWRIRSCSSALLCSKAGSFCTLLVLLFFLFLIKY